MFWSPGPEVVKDVDALTAHEKRFGETGADEFRPAGAEKPQCLRLSLMRTESPRAVAVLIYGAYARIWPAVTQICL